MESAFSSSPASEIFIPKLLKDDAADEVLDAIWDLHDPQIEIAPSDRQHVTRECRPAERF